MVAIINLLNSKNHYLEKFYTLNEEHILRFHQGEIEFLEDFYDRREKILETIQYIDTRIEQEQSLVGDSVSELDRKQIWEALTVKDEFVRRILDQDLEILAKMDEIKSNIIQELRGVGKNKNQLGKFKSPTFQKRLDEVG